MKITLYKKSSNKIRFWEIELVNDMQIGYLISTGKLNSNGEKGKHMPKFTKVEEGTNKGKINERSPIEQALFEIQAKTKLKKKDNYRSLEELHYNNQPLVEFLIEKLPSENLLEGSRLKIMKAKTHKDLKTGKIVNQFKYPIIVQPKLDGFRCTSGLEIQEIEKNTLFQHEQQKVVLRSSENNIFTGFPDRISKELEILYFEILTDINNNLIGYDSIKNNTLNKNKLFFDGELYIHGLKRQHTTSAIRKANPNSFKLQYHIFDLAVEGIKQSKRLKLITELIIKSKIIEKLSVIKVVPSVTCYNYEQVETEFKRALKMGYEGIVGKEPTSLYSPGKRTNAWVKWKNCIEEEFDIIKVIAAKRDNFEGKPLAIFVCKTLEGESFSVTPVEDKKERAEIYENADYYIGKALTVRYYETSDSGKPTHAIGIIRDYE